MNPFEAARVRMDVIHVVLKTADLIDADPTLTPAEAQRLLTQHGSNIASVMIRAGVIAPIQRKGAKQ